MFGFTTGADTAGRKVPYARVQSVEAASYPAWRGGGYGTGKIYPQKEESGCFYYAEGMFFDVHDCRTNIPGRKQRHYQVPASNPEYAGKFLGVKAHIRIRKCIGKFGVSFVLFFFPAILFCEEPERVTCIILIIMMPVLYI